MSKKEKLFSINLQVVKRNISKYFIGDNNGLPEPFIEHYSYMWHITPLKYIPIKNKPMSIMISEKIGQHSFIF